jgi:hypothetical protein
MVDVNSLFTGELLKPQDLQGREHTVRIASVEVKDFDDGPKLPIEFVAAKKALVANKTTSKRIAFIHRDETNGWVGKKVVLASEMVDYKGSPVLAIRVKPAAVSDPPSKPTSEAAAFNDEHPQF